MIQASDRIAIISGEHRVTFTEMLQRISVFAEHCPAEAGSKTLILSENREGWLYALYAVWSRKGIVVPVDAGSTVHDVAYILKDCTPQAVWVSAEKESLVLAAIEEAGVELKVLHIEDYESADIQPTSPRAEITYEEQSTALICYTSGTTGSPKGVMLSFENIIVNVNSVWKDVPIFSDTRRTLILLPLHHVLPLVGSAVAPIMSGGGVAISPSLAAADIMDTLQRGQVAIMIGVPRLWQTLYRGIKGKIDAKGITRMLFNLCAKVQSRSLSRLIFKSVRDKMGGHITYCVAGGAALDSETAQGLKTLGLDVLEGYGMTEAAPMISFTRPGDILPGCVGLPLPAVEVKIQDGELCARGRNVMQGYYNRPEETAAIIDSEGWLHTGDLAAIDEKGRIRITGRKKEIIVLSNGKNVNPSEIEEEIEQYQDIVKEAAVTEKDDLLCLIVVPQAAWAYGKTDAEMEELIKTGVMQPYNSSVAPYKKLMSLHLHHGDLPRTRLEKLQRFKLRELLEQSSDNRRKTTDGRGGTTDNEQQTAEGKQPMPPLFSTEGQIIADYIQTEKHIPVKPTDNLETDLAMDSLDKVSLQGFIEQTFGMTLTTEQLTAFASVKDLADYVAVAKTREEVADIDWHKLLTHGDDEDGSQARKHQTPLPHMGFVGRAFMGICRMIMRPMFSPEIKGLENIPTEGAFILAPNHQSLMDGPLAISGLNKDTLARTFFYAKKDHMKGAFRRMIARNHNIIVMDMSTLSDSIHQLAQVLSQEKGLVIFPEGTRTHDGKVGTFKKAFAILAKELNVKVIPVRIEGAFEAWPRTKALPRPHKVSVEYLPALTAKPNETYEEFAERVRTTIIK